jgi:peptidoglycan/LPS O-acetylase OafA/YrhL
MAQSTLTKIKSSAAELPSKARGKRPDIQGLRAIAVIAVILDHLMHWPSGGFVGVDVFFVISGFLITGQLIREHDKTGKISIPGFYRRRVRRILPASLVVLAATAVFGYLIFNAGRAQQTFGDAVWAFFFSANWHFAAVGTDYFQSTGPVSPLQHFWSLAVEEQFYFAWPALMILILWMGGRSTKWNKARAHRAIGLAMLAIVVLSFGWAMHQSATSPTVAYFSTFTRAWELGVGALLAVFAAAFKSIPAMLRPVLGWAGLAGIAWSIFTVTADMPFPAPWAAAPVLATALVIAAGTGGEQRYMWPLTNRVTGYVGDISYSLYLWHFPVIIFLASLVKEDSPLYIPVTVAVMAVLSVLSFHFVEERVRKSTWLDDSAAAKAIRRNRRHQRSTLKLGTQLLVLGVLAVLALGTAGYALLQSRPASPEALALPTASAKATGSAKVTPAAARTAAVQAALTATAWPKLIPDVGELEAKGRAAVSCEVGPSDAVPAEEDVLSTCLNGDKAAKKTAFLLGDSYAAALSPGIVAALAPEYKVVVLTRNSCPAVGVAVKLADGSEYPQCSEFQSFAEDQVLKNKPDLVVVTGWHGQVIDRLASGATGPAAITEWKAGLTNSVKTFASAAKQVVVLAGPPTGRNLQECATPLSKPADCVAPVPGEYKTFSDGERAAVTALGQKMVKYVPVQDWFCAADRCPPFIGANPVYVDGGHLTTTTAKAIAPLLRQGLLS